MRPALQKSFGLIRPLHASQLVSANLLAIALGILCEGSSQDRPDHSSALTCRRHHSPCPITMVNSLLRGDRLPHVLAPALAQKECRTAKSSDWRKSITFPVQSAILYLALASPINENRASLAALVGPIVTAYYRCLSKIGSIW